MNEATTAQLSHLENWNQELPNEWRFTCPCCGDEGWLERNPKINLIGCFSGCHPAAICYGAGVSLSDVLYQRNKLSREIYTGLIKTAITDAVRVSDVDRYEYLQITKQLSRAA